MNSFEFQFCVAADHPCLPGHFPGNPVVPGVLLIDQMLDAVQRLTGRPMEMLQQVKFMSALLPGERADASFEVEGDRVVFRIDVTRGNHVSRVAQGSGTLSAPVPA